MEENRNTYVVKEMLRHIEDLRMELADLESERRGNYVKPQFLIDDDDEYQEALERSYENADLDERIESIKERIWDLQQELIDMSK
jgi:hypothetical protein